MIENLIPKVINILGSVMVFSDSISLTEMTDHMLVSVQVFKYHNGLFWQLLTTYGMEVWRIMRKMSSSCSFTQEQMIQKKGLKNSSSKYRKVTTQDSINQEHIKKVQTTQYVSWKDHTIGKSIFNSTLKLHQWRRKISTFLASHMISRNGKNKFKLIACTAKKD